MHDQCEHENYCEYCLSYSEYSVLYIRSYMGQQTDLSLPLYIYNFLSIHNWCTNKYTIVFSFMRATDWCKKCAVRIFLDDFPIPQIGHVPLSE